MPRNGPTPTSPPSCAPTPSLLGIETSCDETAAAVFSLQGRLLSNLVASQHEVHGRFGGVVPELASRKHVERIEEITQAALNQAGVGWSDLRAIAVTQGPGLAGALVVGVSFGKALAYALGVPCIGVHHLEGHIASAWLEYPDFTTPCIVLVVSGGHTHLYLVPQRGEYRLLGKTLDDAAGEAFDKGAKMLGLSYPGGPALDRLAQTGDPSIVRFPRPYLNKGGFNFSFSGLKTSLLYYLRDRQSRQESTLPAHVAAGYQEAIVDVLVEKIVPGSAPPRRRRLGGGWRGLCEFPLTHGFTGSRGKGRHSSGVAADAVLYGQCRDGGGSRVVGLPGTAVGFVGPGCPARFGDRSHDVAKRFGCHDVTE